jgi:ribonuclease HII
MRWVGIDEAGYGPNLGPLVMTAVLAEGTDARAPDVWADLAAAVSRAGGDPGLLWIDDSKALYKAGKGRDRLDAACLAALAASGREPPATFGGLLQAIEAGTLADVEIAPWLDADDPDWPRPDSRELHEKYRALGPFRGAPWRIVAIHTVVVGPARFNATLEQTGSKAKVHFAAFARLLGSLWERARDGLATHVVCDKHGGRHFYLDGLLEYLPDVWIDRGPEGPELSRYTVRSPGRRLELTLMPRADAGDGLVALASIISKAVREAWMDSFNAHWTARLPDLRPTAGYPSDANRFRRAIEAECQARGLHPNLWWRAR